MALAEFRTRREEARDARDRARETDIVIVTIIVFTSDCHDIVNG